MASQITHIPYGEKVLKKFLGKRDIDTKKFYIGTLFPDIRYLKVISREATHPDNPTIEALLDIKNDFDIGAYSHVLVDIERERVLKKAGVYNILSPDPITFYAMKFIEDELTYPVYNEWQKIITYLDDILPEEASLVPIESIKKWHGLLQIYFSSRPQLDSFTKFAQQLDIDTKVIEAIKIKIGEINMHKSVVEAIKNTYNSMFI